MRKQMFIRRESGKAYAASWWLSDGHAEGPSQIKSGSLAEAAAAAEGMRVIALVPTCDVLLASASVPATQRRRIATAVPYALEDLLAEDVEKLHFAIGAKEFGNTVACAAVSHAVIKQWQAEFETSGLQVAALYPDVFGVSVQPTEWTLLLEDQGALLRTGPQAGMALDRENLQDSLMLMLASLGEAKPACLRVIDVRADEQAPLMLDASIEIEWTPSNDPAISVLATNLDEANAIDLLQGEYSKREQLSKLWRPWRAAAALLLVWVVAQLAAMGFEYRQLQSLSIAQRKQAEEIYTQTFPESRKGQDLSVIRAEMKRKTEALRGGGADGQGAFLTMLSDVGEPISKAPSVALERLSYRVGEINVSFSIADVQQLDELKQKLAATGGLVIEIQSAAQRDGKVDARLNIAKAGT